MPSQDQVHGRARYDPTSSVLSLTRVFSTGRVLERTYFVNRLTEYPAIPGPAFELESFEMDGNTRVILDRYTAAMTEHGPTCTCADDTFRRQNEEQRCKHIKALQVVGLMPKRVP